MKTGDNVLISPEVTHKSDWTQGTVIDVEANPFVGSSLPRHQAERFTSTRNINSNPLSKPMYALSFDMRSNLFALLAKNIAELEEHYGKPYHGAYYEIKRTLVGSTGYRAVPT